MKLRLNGHLGYSSIGVEIAQVQGWGRGVEGEASRQ